jgi:hypothetical protein
MDGEVGDRPIARPPNRPFQIFASTPPAASELSDWETIKLAVDPLGPLNNVSEQSPRRGKHVALLCRRDLASWPNGTQTTGSSVTPPVRP